MFMRMNLRSKISFDPQKWNMTIICGQREYNIKAVFVVVKPGDWSTDLLDNFYLHSPHLYALLTMFAGLVMALIGSLLTMLVVSPPSCLSLYLCFYLILSLEGHLFTITLEKNILKISTFGLKFPRHKSVQVQSVSLFLKTINSMVTKLDAKVWRS